MRRLFLTHWFVLTTLTALFVAISSADEEKESELSWAIYWYLCGSDLETEARLATDDLNEMLEAALPDDVAVIIQTGGAKEWQNDLIAPAKSQRFLYHKGDLKLLGETSKVNMVKPQR